MEQNIYPRGGFKVVDLLNEQKQYLSDFIVVAIMQLLQNRNPKN